MKTNYKLALAVLTKGTEGTAVPEIIAEDRKAGAAIRRIKEIYGEK